MDSALVTFLVNLGTAGVVIICIIAGWLDPGWVRRKNEATIEHLREALELERQRNGDLSGQAGITVQLLGTIRDLAADRRAALPAAPPAAQPEGGADLTWSDLK